MPMTTPGGETTAQRFGRVIADAARSAGYDIDSPRGGGKTELARDTGMGASAVTRMLKGETVPDPRFYEPLARAVKLPLSRLMVEAGLISAESLTQPTQTRVVSPITPEEAATELGITSPEDRQLFIGVVQRLLNRPNDRPTDDDTGSEAAQA